jgi:cytochrome o ubiquinol oxidase operon protein cyoD
MKPSSAASSGMREATLRAYVTGFVLALVLTLIPFALVIAGGLPERAVVTVIVVAGIAQILVHLHYFLHLDLSVRQRWKLLTLVFTAVILVIMIGGTIWIMLNLSAAMLPQ